MRIAIWYCQSKQGVTKCALASQGDVTKELKFRSKGFPKCEKSDGISNWKKEKGSWSKLQLQIIRLFSSAHRAA